jgi:uncharacterized membrane protein YbhN (UPF0104 family)
MLIDGEPATPQGMLLHGWKGIAQAVAIVAITVGAGYAVYAERATVQKGLAVLPHLRVGWLLAGIGAECLSMLAFGQLQRGLLRAGGAVGLALRYPAIRSWLAVRVTAVLRFSQRVIKRPRSDPEQTVGDMLTTIGGLRLGWRTVAVALVAALLNWLTDVACLICAIKAAGAGIPWSAILGQSGPAPSREPRPPQRPRPPHPPCHPRRAARLSWLHMIV